MSSPSQTRRRFSITAVWSSPTERETSRVSYGGALAPPLRSRNAARTPMRSSGSFTSAWTPPPSSRRSNPTCAPPDEEQQRKEGGEAARGGGRAPLRFVLPAPTTAGPRGAVELQLFRKSGMSRSSSSEKSAESA